MKPELSPSEQVTHAIRLLERELHDERDPLLLFVPDEVKAELLSRLRRMSEILRNPSATGPETFHVADQVMSNWPHTALGSALVKAERAYRDSMRKRRT